MWEFQVSLHCRLNHVTLFLVRPNAYADGLSVVLSLTSVVQSSAIVYSSDFTPP